MIPVKTDTTNTVLTLDSCEDLPGTQYAYEDGTPGIETCWELSPEEVKQLVEAEHPRIYLYTLGLTVPPLFLSTECKIIADTAESEAAE